jgi:predicted nucleotidyltransferase component of viral defense system
MTLHHNKDLFQDAVVITSQQKGIREIYIEKDYWVTLALKTIFTDAICQDVVFKGGTALSKCFQLIDRFSEDIDVVVLRREGENENQWGKKIKKVSHAVKNLIPEVEVEGITNKRGRIRKTAHDYEKLFEGDFEQVRDMIIVEATHLGNFEPYTNASVQSYIAEMMQETGQSDLIKTYQLEPFAVRVLTVERTLCEKIMSLVRFSFEENPIPKLNDKIRHIYDIHQLLDNEVFYTFFHSQGFEEMLLKVADDDIRSFKNNNDWLVKHPATALIFSDIDNTWQQLKRTYETNFAAIVYGKLPNEKALFQTLEAVSRRLRSIEWVITKV